MDNSSVLDDMPDSNMNNSDQSGSNSGSSDGLAWGSTSYSGESSSASQDWAWTANLTTDDYLEMMLGPKQVNINILRTIILKIYNFKLIRAWSIVLMRIWFDYIYKKLRH